MKHFLLSLGIFCFFNATVFAQNGTPQNAGARGAAMGNAALTFTDLNAAYVNQAGLAFLDELSFGVYAENRFLAQGLNSFLFAAAYPNEKIGTFGVTVNYFGYENYNEQKIGLAYARKLSETFSLGVQLDYLGTRIPQYGTAASFTFEVGILAKLTEQFSLAAHVYNPTRTTVAGLDRLPSLLNLGLAYQPSEKVLLTAELEKDIYDHPLMGKFGCEYRPIHALAVRAGVQAAAEATQMSFGVGLYLQSLRIDLSTAYHQVLGFTPAFGLSYGLNPSSIDTSPQEIEIE
jgi:hypothetical protein